MRDANAAAAKHLATKKARQLSRYKWDAANCAQSNLVRSFALFRRAAGVASSAADSHCAAHALAGWQKERMVKQMVGMPSLKVSAVSNNEFRGEIAGWTKP